MCIIFFDKKTIATKTQNTDEIIRNNSGKKDKK